jgi:hypothetical protein
MNEVRLDGQATHVDDSAGIEVVGPPQAAAFPPLCVNCGAAAGGAVRITKVFRRYSEDPAFPYGVYSLNAPVCAPCKELHRSQAQPPDPVVRRARLRRWFWDALFPYSLPLTALAVITYIVGPPLIPEIARNSGIPSALIWGGVGAFFALLMLIFFIAFVARGRYQLIAVPTSPESSWHAQIDRGPLGARLILPVEPTTIVASLDFSDNVGDILAGQRHRYWFRNINVGAQFAEANANRVWNPRSPRARISLALWVILFAGLIVLLILATFGDLVGIRLSWLPRK